MRCRRLGYDIRLEKEYPASKEPVIMLSRHDNAFMFSVCAADTTVKTPVAVSAWRAAFACGRNDD